MFHSVKFLCASLYLCAEKKKLNMFLKYETFALGQPYSMCVLQLLEKGMYMGGENARDMQEV